MTPAGKFFRLYESTGSSWSTAHAPAGRRLGQSGRLIPEFFFHIMQCFKYSLKMFHCFCRVSLFLFLFCFFLFFFISIFLFLFFSFSFFFFFVFVIFISFFSSPHLFLSLFFFFPPIAIAGFKFIEDSH